MNVLVTGAAGFIGSHLTERLLRDGHTVVGVDDFDPFYPRAIKESFLAEAREHPAFRLVEGDVREVEDLRRAGTAGRELSDAPQSQSASAFDAVFHLAALAGVRPSIADPVRYESVNVGGTQQLLDWCREEGVGRIVFGSSSSVYGDADEAPFREGQDVGRPISTYAATKRAAELLCHAHHHLHDAGVLCLRFFTVYGPRQRPDLAIHKFARLLTRGEPIPRFGDGTSRRDYTYVDDVVEGIVRALAYLEGRPGAWDVVNLGNSETVRLNRLIRLVGEAMSVEPEVTELPEQPGDVRQTWADITKAGELFGWRPEVGIDEGIRRFAAWFRAHREVLE